MGGLVLILLLGLYGWISYKVIHGAKRPLVKVLLIAVVVLIPTADAMYGRVKLKQMCKAEGGLRVEKTADRVEGLYEDRVGPPDEGWITRFHFSFAEARGQLDGKLVVVRLTRQPSGSIVLDTGVQQMSRYELRNAPGNPSDIYMRNEIIVEKIGGGEVMGRVVNFNYAGGAIERFMAALSDSGRATAATCGLDPDIRASAQRLVAATLKPIDQPAGGKK